jgi:preprotein translocase subunit SecE
LGVRVPPRLPTTEASESVEVVTKEDEDDRSSPAGWADTTRQYFLDVRTELRKVTWPSRQEAVGGTIGVLVIVGVITLVLGVVDVALAKFVEAVLP